MGFGVWVLGCGFWGVGVGLGRWVWEKSGAERCTRAQRVWYRSETDFDLFFPNSYCWERWIFVRNIAGLGLLVKEKA